MRDNHWLLQETKRLWCQYFPDRHFHNKIIVFFSRKNRRVLGSIKYDQRKNTTLIRINGYFRSENIPPYVVCNTLAHELVHYVHGFSSPQAQRYRYPHQGGVVSREIAARGLGTLEKKSKKWLKQNWPKFLLQNRTLPRATQ